jgi:hypothetical protein
MTTNKEIKEANERSLKYMAETYALVNDIKRNIPDWRSRLSPNTVKLIKSIKESK